jgi:hypothetical protein
VSEFDKVYIFLVSGRSEKYRPGRYRRFCGMLGKQFVFGEGKSLASHGFQNSCDCGRR